MLKGVEAKTQELNEHILPPDVKVRAYYDRSDLVQLTIDTVEHNLLVGMALVLVVLLAFLVSFRAAVIVALTIPLSLLFSFIFLHAEGIPANLLSIGAIDFGILIDGTLVMVENIFRELGAREGQEYDLEDVILKAAKDVDRPIFYSVAVIIAGYLPIYALTGPSGKLFKPMADTVAIALVGAMILTLTLVPVLCAMWFKKGVHERENKPFEWVRRKYAVWLDWCLDRPETTMALSMVIFAASLLLIPFIGGEFMPHLDEGALWIRATMPYTVSFETSSRFSPQVRDILMKYPMVTDVGSELGRPDDGTDPTGFYNDEFYVGLKPYDDAAWKTGAIHNKAELTADIQRQLDVFPGVIFNYTQPAEDAVDEALTGLKSALAVKIYGPDLNVLQNTAQVVKQRLSQVPGFTELTVVRQLGQPTPDHQRGSRQNCALRHQRSRRGGDCAGGRGRAGGHAGGAGRKALRPGGAHEAGVPPERAADREPAGGNAGGAADSTERAGRYSRVGRGGAHLSRKQLSVYRRAVQRGGPRPGERGECRPAGDCRHSEIAAHGIPDDVGRRVRRVSGRAKHQLAIIGPLALLIIFMILFALYDNFKFPMVILLGVVLTDPVGALLALKLTHTPFSASSALGLLALIGVSVETAVILVSYINKLRIEQKMDIRTATREASLLRLRPIMMTALVACLGLLPAALSTGIGSDTQKPFAIVIVAGLVSRLFLGFFVNPVLYQMVAREGDVLKV